MTVYIKPSKAKGTISAVPSKSVSHRALICAALSSGCGVQNISYSDDINATLGALKSFGTKISKGETSVNLGGLNPNNISEIIADCGESGSTLRFLIPLAMVSGTKIKFTGSKRLFERDLSVYEEMAKERGISFILDKTSLTVKGRLQAGEFLVPGNISSQFVSGLMFALPLLEGDSIISFKTKPESRPYIDITIKVLSDFGIDIKSTDNGYFIRGNQIYKNHNYTVEGDYSNAAFLDAFNLIGGNVTVTGLNEDTAQGDSIYKQFFKTLKAYGSYDLRDYPDLAPVMFTLAAAFSGARFTGTSRLRIKESDRASVMREELSKFGAKLNVKENEVIVEKSTLHAPDISLNSHNDHRVVMALTLLLSRFGGVIEGAEAVSKSYPDFFSDIKKLGIEVEIK